MRIRPTFRGDADPDPDIATRNCRSRSTIEFRSAQHRSFVVGGFYQDKDRRHQHQPAEQERRAAAPSQHLEPVRRQSPDDLAEPFDDFEPEPGGINKIQEDRKDLFALVEGDSGSASSGKPAFAGRTPTSRSTTPRSIPKTRSTRAD